VRRGSSNVVNDEKSIPQEKEIKVNEKPAEQNPS
jgi:hypothetical protein